MFDDATLASQPPKGQQRTAASNAHGTLRPAGTVRTDDSSESSGA